MYLSLGGPYSHAEAEGSAVIPEWKAKPSAGLVEASEGSGASALIPDLCASLVSGCADSGYRFSLCLMLLSCIAYDACPIDLVCPRSAETQMQCPMGRWADLLSLGWDPSSQEGKLVRLVRLIQDLVVAQTPLASSLGVLKPAGGLEDYPPFYQAITVHEQCALVRQDTKGCLCWNCWCS